MSFICPVSNIKINEYTARLTNFTMVVLLVLYIFLKIEYLLFITTFDYLFRSFLNIKYSPVSFAYNMLFKLINAPVKLKDKAPKVFASRVGFLLSATALVLFYFYPLGSLTAAGVLAFCSFMDSVFNYCFGCLIYYKIVLPFYK